MTIIGLLIGGILKGQELMLNARVMSTIAQVNSFNAGLIAFQDTYAGRPGDLPSATTRLPNCSPATGCANGDGNGFVGVQAGAWMDIDPALNSENTQFWKHLCASDIISGCNPGALTVAWGQTHPAGRFNGGYFAREGDWAFTVAPNGQSYELPNGLVLVMRAQIDGTWQDGNALAPRYAALIDRKMDDGFAVTGYVRSISVGWIAGCGHPSAGVNGPNGYQDSGSSDRCDMFFRF